MWDLRATAAIKNKELPKQNLRLLYTVVMSLCAPIMEDKLSCHENFASIKHTRYTIKLLQLIKQLMYTDGIEEMHSIHNQVMATINLFRMRQVRGQSPQNFQEQFTVMRQVCYKLGLHIRQSEQGAQAILKKERVTSPTGEQLEEEGKGLQRIPCNPIFVSSGLTTFTGGHGECCTQDERPFSEEFK